MRGGRHQRVLWFPSDASPSYVSSRWFCIQKRLISTPCRDLSCAKNPYVAPINYKYRRVGAVPPTGTLRYTIRETRVPKKDVLSNKVAFFLPLPTVWGAGWWGEQLKKPNSGLLCLGTIRDGNSPKRGVAGQSSSRKVPGRVFFTLVTSAD